MHMHMQQERLTDCAPIIPGWPSFKEAFPTFICIIFSRIINQYIRMWPPTIFCSTRALLDVWKMPIMATSEGRPWVDTSTTSRTCIPTLILPDSDPRTSAAAEPSSVVITPEGASPPTTQVNYEDATEKRNASLQVSWNEWMAEGTPRSTVYKRVAVLSISWEAKDDDLNVETEVLPWLAPNAL